MDRPSSRIRFVHRIFASVRVCPFMQSWKRKARSLSCLFFFFWFCLVPLSFSCFSFPTAKSTRKRGEPPSLLFAFYLFLLSSFFLSLSRLHTHLLHLLTTEHGHTPSCSKTRLVSRAQADGYGPVTQDNAVNLLRRAFLMRPRGLLHPGLRYWKGKAWLPKKKTKRKGTQARTRRPAR